MKSALFIFAVLVLAFSTCFAGPKVGATEVGGDFWFRYHMDRMDESTQRSAFNVERGYLGVGYAWSPEVSGQVTLNVFSSPSQSELTGWQFELRDAYVNLGYFVPQGKMRIGLQKNYFGTVYDWKYLTVRRSLADAVGVVQERDYGVALMGAIPNGLGEWTLAFMNGEGFESGLNPPWADRQPNVMANVRLMPRMETTVGLSFLMDKRYVYTWDDSARIGYGDRTAASLLVKAGTGPFSLMGEYVYYKYPIPDRNDPYNQVAEVTGRGFSVFPMVRMSEKMDLVGRFDSWDPDQDSDRSIWIRGSDDDPTPDQWWVPSDYAAQYYYVKHNVYVVGFNYNITERMEGAPGVILQVNWQRMDPQEDLGDQALKPLDSYVFQVRWGWGGLDF